MPRTLALLDTHAWLVARLTERAAPDPRLVWTGDVAAAEVVLAPHPPWPDATRRGVLRRALPRIAGRVVAYDQGDAPLAWLPGVYCSATPSAALRPSFAGGVYVMPHHHEPEHEGLFDPRPWDDVDLRWSFIGSVDTCPAVRGAVVGLDDPDAVTADSADWMHRHRWTPGEDRSAAIRSFTEVLHRSAFVVCPRGVGHSSIRLFETMRAARCPVVVADRWMPPPGPDWDAIVLRVREAEVGTLPRLLREREGEARERGRRAREAWEHHYAPEHVLTTLGLSALAVQDAGGGAARRVAVAARAAASRPAVRLARDAARRRAGAARGRG